MQGVRSRAWETSSSVAARSATRASSVSLAAIRSSWLRRTSSASPSSASIAGRPMPTCGRTASHQAATMALRGRMTAT
ncbi:hypothetical protein ACFQY5_30285 [Paeniroseomonas aquatica]|uniref:hypothetical protein n=1 Tax=Paeniroseomonas aquatica TaxID=373043 RepID=UPI00360B0476